MGQFIGEIIPKGVVPYILAPLIPKTKSGNMLSGIDILKAISYKSDLANP